MVVVVTVPEVVSVVMPAAAHMTALPHEDRPDAWRGTETGDTFGQVNGDTRASGKQRERCRITLSAVEREAAAYRASMTR